MRSRTAFVALWIGLLAFSLLAWVGLFYLGAAFVWAWSEHPGVKLASAVAVLGALAFWAGDMLPEMKVNAQERSR